MSLDDTYDMMMFEDPEAYYEAYGQGDQIQDREGADFAALLLFFVKASG